MKIEMTFDGVRVDGTLDGKTFAVVRRGAETSLEGITGDDTFGGMVGSAILDFAGHVLDGAVIIMEATDDLKVWDKLDDDLANEVYDAMI